MGSGKRASAAVLLQSSSKQTMPIDPTFLPPAASPEEPATRAELLPVAAGSAAQPSATTPNIGHTLLFGLLVAVAGFLVGLAFALVVMHVAPHLHESAEQMQTDPLLVIPAEAVIYAIAAAASFLIFPLLALRLHPRLKNWPSAASCCRR